MLLVLAVKTLVLGGCMLPIAFGALGTGVLFAGYNLAVARISPLYSTAILFITSASSVAILNPRNINNILMLSIIIFWITIYYI